MLSEREKMLSGVPYNSRDPELLGLYYQARELLKEWENCSSRDSKRKSDLLKQLFDQIGVGVWIEAPFYCDYGKHIQIGQNTFIHTGAVFLDSAWVKIGKNVLIGPRVQIYTAGHPLSVEDRIPQEESAPYVTHAQPVSIGDACWIGGGTIILPGVKIGSNTTVAAGSLVTKDLPDGVLAVGSPAKVIRKL